MATTLAAPDSDLETQPESRFSSKDSADILRIVPLGGVEEFGMNILCYECGEERVVVDCGAMFPDAEMPGVDLVIPDVSCLLAAPERLKAILLTHAHDDHIGALPYLLPQMRAPVYGTPLTLAFLRAKLEEHDLLDQIELNTLDYGKTVRIGRNFEIEAIHVTHSVPNAAALAIRTPAGTVLHTGDYKIDHAPVDGNPFDFARLSRLGEEGVLALVADSTNADVPGSTHTERWVARHLEPIFGTSEKAIFCAAFSTSVHRLQVLMDLGVKFDRKIFVAGRSIERTVGIASELGYLHPPRKHMLPLRDIESIPPGKRLILAAGSQAEPLSALSRAVMGEHRHLEITEGDTVILSSRVIPVHYRSISRMINHICQRGARVFDSMSSKVHASGHACREEMKTMIGLTRPRYLVPVHGELRQLMSHRDIAMGMGLDPAHIFILRDGDVLEADMRRAKVVNKVRTGYVFVDGKTIGETGEVVLRDRQHLSEDGMVIAILNVDRQTGALLNDPEIVTRGFVYVDESEALIGDLRALVRESFESCPREVRENPDVINVEIRRALRRYIRRNFDRFPVILPVIQEL